MHIINILINIFMIASLVITGQGSRDILGPPTSEGTPQINESVDRDVFDPPTSTGAPRVVESVKRSVLVEPISAGMSPISTIPSRGSSIAYYTPSWYFPGYGEPIKIRREITPESLRKDYIMGDKLWVTAEVINIKNDMANRYLKNIYIREIIDNDLQVIVPESEGNINKEPLIDFAMTNSFKDISYNELKLFRGESLNYNIKAIRIQDDGIYKDAVICSNETFLRYLFEWRSVLLNEGTERKKMKNYLSETFGLAWIKGNTSINGSIKMIQNGRNSSVIYINRTDYNEKNDYIKLQIDDIDNISSKGELIVDISGDRSYELKYKVENNSIYVYDWDTILKLNIDTLGPKDKLIYRYSVKPKRSGIFNLKSMVRIEDNEYLASSDIVYPTVMEVENPDLSFRVAPILEKDHIYPDIWNLNPFKWFNKILTLRYEIIFTGDTLDEYIDNILIKLDDAPNGSHYIDENGTGSNFKGDFSGKKTYLVTKDIKFEKPGIYIMPGINVEGEHYLFVDKKITVEDTWAFLLDKLIAFNTFIIIIGSLLAKKQIKEFIAYLQKRIFGRKNNEKGTDKELHDKIIEIIGVWSTSSQEIKDLQKKVDDLNDKINGKK